MSGLRLERLRGLMKEHGLQAYIVPSEDAHQSEYIAACDRRREYLSGFTGSAGFAIVLHDRATLWTDSRYWLQAQEQLSDHWVLVKQGSPTLSREDWLPTVLAPHSKVGVDAALISVKAAKKLKRALEEKSHELVAQNINLVDLIWENQPAKPSHIVKIQETGYSGSSPGKKLLELRTTLAKKKLYGVVLTSLDEIAWLFDLRGSDIIFNPVFFSYALVTSDVCILYIDKKKIDKEVREHLPPQVELRKYGQIFSDLVELAPTLSESKKILVSSSCSLAIRTAFGSVPHVEEGDTPVLISKAVKNSVEEEGMRQSHLHDAVALCKFFAWLEEEVDERSQKGETPLTEVEAAEKAEFFRKKQPLYVGLSFETISASGPNAAIVHYAPDEKTCGVITKKQLFLLDSGAQYKNGTTDVTRTIHLGCPTQEERACFTSVLKGHIAIDSVKFPVGTSGFQLDILARVPLWSQGLNYGHGTGHGVGAHLHVHEGPHGIGPNVARHDYPLQPKMMVTNEPGFYRENKFGIRIENVLVCQTEEKLPGFLGFESLTLVPIQTSLIDKSVLTPFERDWVNDYHMRCREKVGPLIEPNSNAMKWLLKHSQLI
eukprot:Lithocolla_globosa_v1_NODE_2639_length_1924_cov_24.632424.p1 type:complete len:601 gc:universal NODE_2639_length_1924_cov_24.632424:40-1842(+)